MIRLYTSNRYHIFSVIIYFRKCTETSIRHKMGELHTAELDEATTMLHNSTRPFNILSFIRSLAYC